VDEFQQLGSLITTVGTMDDDTDRRIAHASSAIRKAVLMDRNLCLPIKKSI